MMRVIAILFLLNLGVTASFGQKVGGATPIREFIFKTKADSIVFAVLDSIWRNTAWSADKASQRLTDSLSNMRSELIKNSIGFRYYYSPRYVLWEELDSSARLNVTRLSLSNWNSEKLPEEILQCKNL